MSEERSFLIWITNGDVLYKVALKVRSKMLTGDAAEFRLEPENREQFNKLLPPHVQSCGKIIQIDEIFEVIDLSDAPNNLRGVI